MALSWYTGERLTECKARCHDYVIGYDYCELEYTQAHVWWDLAHENSTYLVQPTKLHKSYSHQLISSPQVSSFSDKHLYSLLLTFKNGGVGGGGHAKPTKNSFISCFTCIKIEDLLHRIVILKPCIHTYVSDSLAIIGKLTVRDLLNIMNAITYHILKKMIADSCWREAEIKE